ncbi:MAG: NAD(P)-binding protein [Pontixanthobacter sp.]
MTDAQTDYLIIGAGAVGLAFADTLLDEDPDCRITIVDKHAKPGGHWNDAYGFVALHQPSAFYGVNSMEFGDDVPDDHGPNKGHFPLASGTEVSAYFTRLMNRRFLPSGRVDYRPLCEVIEVADGKGRVRSILSGTETSIEIRRKTVDATFYKTSVPSTHKRPFAVADGVDIAIPGDLTDLWQRADDLPAHYCILGGGKTAMDVGVWLLAAGIEPSAIQWVRPRDSWLINRRYTQPGPDHFADIVANQIAQLDAAADAADGDAMFAELGDGGYMLRIDETVTPTMFHYATISQGEVDELRRITNVIRHGRVTAIERGRLVFGDTHVSMPDHTLYIDCTASAVPFDDIREHGPQFRGDTIMLQPIQVPLVTLSAALTAFIEVHYDDDARKNALAAPAPLTDTPNTYPLGLLGNLTNRGKWSQEPRIAAWLSQARLDPTGRTMATMMAEGDTRLSAIGGMGPAIAKGMPGLKRLAVAAQRQHEKDVARCCD